MNQSMTIPLDPVDPALTEKVSAALTSYGVITKGQVVEVYRGQVGHVAVIYRVLPLPRGLVDLTEPIGVEKLGIEELSLLIAQGVKASQGK